MRFETQKPDLDARVGGVLPQGRLKITADAGGRHGAAYVPRDAESKPVYEPRPTYRPKK